MRFYKLALVKAWFDKGYNITHYFFKFTAVSGFLLGEGKATIIILSIYSVLLFLIGWAAFKYGYVEAETEVMNQVDPFVKEMRKKIKSVA